MINVVHPGKVARLKQLEGVVERGKKTFVKVGNALKEIRDQELYKVTHRSFAAYVEDRFGFKRHNAYHLIQAAEASDSVKHVQHIENARQAAEVAKAPAEHRDAVVERAAEIASERDTKPTAKIIAEARDEIIGAKQGSPIEAAPRTDPVEALAAIVRTLETDQLVAMRNLIDSVLGEVNSSGGKC